jgi:hypothetical protein
MHAPLISVQIAGLKCDLDGRLEQVIRLFVFGSHFSPAARLSNIYITTLTENAATNMPGTFTLRSSITDLT